MLVSQVLNKKIKTQHVIVPLKLGERNLTCMCINIEKKSSSLLSVDIGIIYLGMRLIDRVQMATQSCSPTKIAQLHPKL